MSDKIREAFEKFHAEHLRKIGMDEHDIATERDRLENGDYQWSMAAEAWPYWQAAALAQQLDEQPDTVKMRDLLKRYFNALDRFDREGPVSIVVAAAKEADVLEQELRALLGKEGKA